MNSNEYLERKLELLDNYAKVMKMSLSYKDPVKNMVMMFVNYVTLFCDCSPVVNFGEQAPQATIYFIEKDMETMNNMVKGDFSNIMSELGLPARKDMDGGVTIEINTLASCYRMMAFALDALQKKGEI